MPNQKMGTILVSIAAFSFMLLSPSNAAETVFDITKYGAKENADASQALLNAWKGACESESPTKIVIPKGTYLIGSKVTLKGPCKAPLKFHLQGTLRAPADPTALKGEGGWITFSYTDLLTLLGPGTFDGQGKIAWSLNNCDKNPKCQKLPINLVFNFVTNSMVQHITSLDSKNFHVNLLGCKNLTFDHVTITAPESSINTDGIHVGRSDDINIINSDIKTGDDCISLGDGSRKVTITGVTCGPGHGIAIGSLGKYTNEEPVYGITVKNCTLTNTMNGVRIKTWPASPKSGTASDMHFEDITMVNVGTPVLIDQGYCPYNQCKASIPSKIKISNVSFKNIRGSSSTAEVVKLVCSKGVPCEGVELGDIHLTYNGKEGPAKSTCANVKPTLSGVQNPPVCTASAA